jgi:hypothetical protein
MNQLLLNIKGVSCAAINAGIKHAQNSSANSKIEDAEKLDLSIVSFVPETFRISSLKSGFMINPDSFSSLPAIHNIVFLYLSSCSAIFSIVDMLAFRKIGWISVIKNGFWC